LPKVKRIRKIKINKKIKKMAIIKIFQNNKNLKTKYLKKQKSPTIHSNKKSNREIFPLQNGKKKKHLTVNMK
jgi:hypothetical protein